MQQPNLGAVRLLLCWAPLPTPQGTQWAALCSPVQLLPARGYVRVVRAVRNASSLSLLEKRDLLPGSWGWGR